MNGGDLAAMAGKHVIVEGRDGAGLGCPHSGLTSWHPEDVRHLYCAAPTCRRFLEAGDVLDTRTPMPDRA